MKTVEQIIESFHQMKWIGGIEDNSRKLKKLWFNLRKPNIMIQSSTGGFRNGSFTFIGITVQIDLKKKQITWSYDENDFEQNSKQANIHPKILSILDDGTNNN